ncbi:MAG: aminodeoxychorismate lyase [Piscirickettsiaceae bacterium]|nr:MAG: aminodeoxychorismate lyase [Piscirickettsiaceae bacterium]
MKYLVNGIDEATISINDRGFQYGDGLFETIMVEKGRAIFLTEHFDRLDKGCDVLGFPAVDRKRLKGEMMSLISSSEFGVLKIILSRGQSERGFLSPRNPDITRVLSFSKSAVSNVQSLKQMNITLCETRLSQQPLLAGLKHLNQLERVLARSEWRQPDITDGLMLDRDEHVIEGTMSNVFIVKDGVIKTTDLSQAGVKGVIRDVIIRQARVLDIECEVVFLTLDDVLNADEVFMTNSIMLLQSVAKFMYKKRVVEFEEGAVAIMMHDVLRKNVVTQSGVAQ